MRGRFVALFCLAFCSPSYCRCCRGRRSRGRRGRAKAEIGGPARLRSVARRLPDALGQPVDEGGFHRLETDGAWFQNCHYPYANTVTGAGHASLLTGCSPDRHGIILNDWYDREPGESVYCATSPRYQQVPPSEKNTDPEAKDERQRQRFAGAPAGADARRHPQGGHRRQGEGRRPVAQGSRQLSARRPEARRLLLVRHQHRQHGDIDLLPRRRASVGRRFQQGTPRR